MQLHPLLPTLKLSFPFHFWSHGWATSLWPYFPIISHLLSSQFFLPNHNTHDPAQAGVYFVLFQMSLPLTMVSPSSPSAFMSYLPRACTLCMAQSDRESSVISITIEQPSTTGTTQTVGPKISYILLPTASHVGFQFLKIFNFYLLNCCAIHLVTYTF